MKTGDNAEGPAAQVAHLALKHADPLLIGSGRVGLPKTMPFWRLGGQIETAPFRVLI